MERHNRKSYLAPPAPKAITRDGSRDSTVFPTSAGDEVTPTNNSYRPQMTPTSGEIPLNYVSDMGSARSERAPPPPTLSLQNLSLDTNDIPSTSRSANSRLQQFEPMSAIEQNSRPVFPGRTSSSSALSSRTHGSALPVRPTPPAGPLPPPPVTTGSWSNGQKQNYYR